MTSHIQLAQMDRGRVDKGERVLFDWERFSDGHAAMDIAPVRTGMGNLSDITQGCQRYCPFNPSYQQGELLKE